MRRYGWTTLLLTVAILWLTITALPGCSSAESQRYLQANREWDALCQAMQPFAETPTTTSTNSRSVAALDDATSQALQSAANRAQSAVVWISVVRPSTTNHQPQMASRQNQATGSQFAHVSASITGGSGIVIGAGLILTNEHVIRDATNLVVEFADGQRYCVERYAVADQLDLAVLRIARTNTTALKIAGTSTTDATFSTSSTWLPSTRPTSENTGVVAMAGPGFPSANKCRIGVIENATLNLQQQLDPAGRRDYRRLLQTSAQIQPGFSGGPLLDETGHLIGINVASAGNAANNNSRGYAIPFNAHTRAVMNKLCSKVSDQ